MKSHKYLKREKFGINLRKKIIKENFITNPGFLPKCPKISPSHLAYTFQNFITVPNSHFSKCQCQLSRGYIHFFMPLPTKPPRVMSWPIAWHDLKLLSSSVPSHLSQICLPPPTCILCFGHTLHITEYILFKHLPLPQITF